ncbi:MAG: DUF488 domain-containing protein [Candidatus Bathyarchaeota archaeon]
MKTLLKPINISRSAESTIWIIGHSNRTQESIIELLREHKIEVLVDIRRFPTSKVEHFKKEAMEKWMPEQGIEYVWLGEELGGYRRGGYKAYMRTKLFKQGKQRLLAILKQKKTCIMCMEPNPKYCHRRFISADLERQDTRVLHIIAKGQTSLLKFKIRNSY